MIERCVSLYNPQCQELQLMGFDSITYHKLFGLSIRNDNENTNKIDLGNCDCICFDEIGLCNFRELTNIYRFINDHQDKLIIATGNSDQNTPFTHKLNNYEDNMKEYLITCRNILFLIKLRYILMNEVKQKMTNKKWNYLKNIYLIKVSVLLMFSKSTISK